MGERITNCVHVNGDLISMVHVNGDLISMVLVNGDFISMVHVIMRPVTSQLNGRNVYI
jgi:hypothetical protein